MVTYPIAFLLALSISVIMTPAVRRVALARGWVEQAGARRVHQQPVPRLGGIAIVLGFFAPLAALLLVDSAVGQGFRASPELAGGLFGGGLVIAALGLYDDFRGAGAYKKFAVQFAVAIALWVLGFRIDNIAAPIVGTISLGVLSLPVTLLWIVGVINAVNLIDGLDGLAAGVAFFTVATNFALAYTYDNGLMCLMMASLGGAVLGFLIFNFNPASIFMGDTGSMFLGFVLAASSLKTSQKGGTAIALLVPVLALGLPIMDTLLAIARRALGGRPMFRADKEHIHHRLMRLLHLNHARAVLVLYGINCLFALAALGVAYSNDANGALLLACVLVVVIVLMRALGYLSLRDARAVGLVRRRNLQFRRSLKAANAQLKNARTLAAIWDVLRPFADAVDASGFALRVGEPAAYELERTAGDGPPVKLALDLTNGGALEVVWRDGRAEVDRDDALALELLAAAANDALARIAIETTAA